jgi:hypothetical protein
VLAPATNEGARFMLQPALDDPNPLLIFGRAADLLVMGAAGARSRPTC